MRPIIMTSAAMVFGMLPMAIALNDGGEIQAPMGRAIIGGVITSTLLTLVVVPVIYSYMDNLSAWAMRRWGRRPDAAVLPAHGPQGAPADR
jgi:Cu/Ag efflux pump CusA